MFKENKKLIYSIAGLFLLIILAQYYMPKPTDWNRNYMGKNKSPFGCYALYNILEGSFAENLEKNTSTLYLLNDKNKTNSSLLIINETVTFNKNDVSALYSYLEKGNSVFIAATSFNGDIADSLHLETQYNYSYYFNTDSLLKKDGEEFKFTATNLKRKTYKYPQLLNTSYFSKFDSTRFKVMATFGGNNACLISTNIKKGRLYLFTAPDVFGNYFIANHPNRTMAYALLSLVKNQTIVWDDYYKTYNVSRDSMLKFIFESDALYYAYLLLLLSLILYMIFEGRRRQRAIPVLSPPANSTLEFVNVISHVYFNSRHHHHIAYEKIKYFYETLRRKFNVNTNQVNDALFTELAELSGVELKQVRQLLTYCERLKTTTAITDYDLIELNRQIHNFNKNSLR